MAIKCDEMCTRCSRSKLGSNIVYKIHFENAKQDILGNVLNDMWNKNKF